MEGQIVNGFALKVADEMLLEGKGVGKNPLVLFSSVVERE